MSQFKIGDLAIIKQCNECPEMVGKCVELLEYVAPGIEHPEYGFTPIPGWVVSGNGLLVNTNHGLQPSDMSAFAECLLMPLRGDFTPEEMREMEKDHA